MNGSTQVFVSQYHKCAFSQNWILVSQTDFTIQELITLTTLLPEIIDFALPLIEEIYKIKDEIKGEANNRQCLAE